MYTCTHIHLHTRIPTPTYTHITYIHSLSHTPTHTHTDVDEEPAQPHLPIALQPELLLTMLLTAQDIARGKLQVFFFRALICITRIFTFYRV